MNEAMKSGEDDARRHTTPMGIISLHVTSLLLLMILLSLVLIIPGVKDNF